MLKKNIVFSLLFCVLVLPRLSGATVSCLVIEAGPPQGDPGSQYSKMWENSLMDVFFDIGHIVSNGRMVRLDRKPDESFPNAAEKDYEEAKENGMDYFLIAIIEQPENGETAKAQSVYLRLFSTKSQDMIKEQVYTDNKQKSAKEENDSIKRAISLIAVQMK